MVRRKNEKILSVLLAVLMLASLGSMAFAEAETEDIDCMGIKITYPDAFGELKGVFYPVPNGAITYEPCVYYMPVLYFAMPEDEVVRIANGDPDELTQEDIDALFSSQGFVAVILVTDGPVEGALDVLGVSEMPGDKDIIEFGTVDNLHYYCVIDKDEDYIKGLDAEYAEEFKMVQSSYLEALKSSELYAPYDPAGELVGGTVSFETTDLDGNAVTSAELFADNEITMINYWGTWCHNCVDELEALAKIHSSLQEKGCGIIGILEDGADPEKLELAKTLMAEKDTNYPNVVLSDSMSFLDEISSFPTSFFVNKEGKILTYPISGAAVNEYEAAVDKLLAGEAVSGQIMPGSAANDAGVYRITVTDNDGEPIKGVAIQFCDDTSCNLGKTGADGVASFDMPEGVNYVVHVLKVPEGYEPNQDEFRTLDVYSDLVIVLNKTA